MLHQLIIWIYGYEYVLIMFLINFYTQLAMLRCFTRAVMY